MKLLKFVCAGLLPLWLGGCILANAQTDLNAIVIPEPQPIEVEDLGNGKIAALYNSCQESDDKKLELTDSIMRDLYHIGFDYKKHKRLHNTHPIYTLGNQLYTITKRIYAKTLSVEQCQKAVQDFNHQLLDAGIFLK